MEKKDIYPTGLGMLLISGAMGYGLRWIRRINNLLTFVLSWYLELWNIVKGREEGYIPYRHRYDPGIWGCGLWFKVEKKGK